MSRPSALVLTPRLPWPLDDGGRIGLWQTVWSCAQEFRTVVVSLDADDRSASSGAEPAVPPAIAELGVELRRVAHAPPSRLAAALRGVSSPWPDQLLRYRSAEFDRAIREEVQRVAPSFALVNHLHLATYFDALDGVAIALREHNVEHVWLRRFAETTRNPALRLYAGAQARKMRSVEAALCERADVVLAIQRDEAAELQRMAPRARVEWLPLGIEFDRFPAPRPASPPIVLASATWNWPPNADGLDAFLERGWPVLRARRPDARLRVAGKGAPAAAIERWRRAGAEVVGYVDSMPEEFAQASVLLVPLWSGAGVRVKIVEAIAASLPVVATPVGAEGLELEPGRHYLSGDTPEALAEGIVSLLDDPLRARAMADETRASVRTLYDLPNVACRSNQLCRSAASGRTAAGAST